MPLFPIFEKMNAVVLSALLFMFLSSLFARNIIEKAMGNLAQDKRTLMAKLFRSDRFINLIILVGLVFSFFCLVYFKFFSEAVSIYVFVAFVMIYLFISTRRMQKKLIQHHFPEAFIRSITISSIIRFIGLIVLCMTVVLQQNA